MKILKALYTKDGDELQVSSSSVPVGTVLYTAAVTPPAGFLICNGAPVGRETYPDLFNAIGTTYGAGDGSTTFNLPNLLGKFAEGSLTPGEVKAPGLPNITGTLGTHWYTTANAYGAMQLVTDAVGKLFSQPSVLDIDGYGLTTFDASRSSSVYGNSDTVQPPAVTLIPIIKAFDSYTNSGIIDVGSLASEVSRKAAVIDSWCEGVNWWREYSDGWIEQGGAFVHGVVAPEGIITYLRPFKNYALSVAFLDCVTPEYVTNTYHECGTSFATSIGYYLTGNHTDFSIAQIVWAAAGYKQ